MAAQEVAQSVPEMSEDERVDDVVRELHDEANVRGGYDWCYFIGGDEGPIKIGKAESVEGRLYQMQPYCPFKIRVLATRPGGRLREQAYHLQFRKARLHNEWFERTPEIEAEMKWLMTGKR